MRLDIIDLHSVAVDLLTPGGWTLDAGARGFRFARELASRGQKVVAMDPAPDIEDPGIPGVIFDKRALVGRTLTGIGCLKRVSDPEAAWVHVDFAPSPIAGKDVALVNTASLADVMERHKVSMWDLIKLNIEGAEYDILGMMNRPVARQIVCSFHEHTGRGYGREGCDRIVSRLSKWYDVVQHVWEPRYCAAANYWDTLLLLRGLS